MRDRNKALWAWLVISVALLVLNWTARNIDRQATLLKRPDAPHITSAYEARIRRPFLPQEKYPLFVQECYNTTLGEEYSTASCWMPEPIKSGDMVVVFFYANQKVETSAYDVRGSTFRKFYDSSGLISEWCVDSPVLPITVIANKPVVSTMSMAEYQNIRCGD